MKPEHNQNSIKKYNKLICGLLNISVKSLEEMYLPEKFEFAMKKKKVKGKVIIEGENLRYSLINLIGLHKAESHNLSTKINLKEIVIHQLNKADKYRGVGELGLLLWATALISPEDIKIILPKINFKNILETYNDAKLGNTMELSWLLTGLLLASTFNAGFKKTIDDLPNLVYNKIRLNYSGVGVFRHKAKISLHGKLRHNIGSFADQVYPIYAFTLYSQQMNNEEALLIAKDCALKMCEHQGKNGQWMWHYDAETGGVVSKFPVYSVHQDAMAPFTLFAVQKATGINFEKYIYKGLEWLEGNNELNVNMIDWKNNVIWRRIAQPNSKRKTKLILSLVGIDLKDDYNSLEVLYESWSYHFGWILFAFAGRVGNNNLEQEQNNRDSNYLRICNFK